ncbi:MAG: hypothetical protein AAFU73_05285 [Planctomycetota bacterium]
MDVTDSVEVPDPMTEAGSTRLSLRRALLDSSGDLLLLGRVRNERDTRLEVGLVRLALGAARVNAEPIFGVGAHGGARLLVRAPLAGAPPATIDWCDAVMLHAADPLEPAERWDWYRRFRASLAGRL